MRQTSISPDAIKTPADIYTPVTKSTGLCFQKALSLLAVALRALLGPIPVSSFPGRSMASVEAVFFEHWRALQRDNISASAFINYLQPLASLDGISVSYLNCQQVGDRHTSDSRSSGSGVVSDASTDPNTRIALSVALNDKGRVGSQSSSAEP